MREALKGADVEDRIKQAATTIYQALIEAELDVEVVAFRDRALAEQPFHYVFAGMSWTRPTARPVSTTGSCAKPWWWRPVRWVECSSSSPMPVRV